MLQQMGERDRALTHFVVDALDDDGYLKVSLTSSPRGACRAGSMPTSCVPQ